MIEAAGKKVSLVIHLNATQAIFDHEGSLFHSRAGKKNMYVLMDDSKDGKQPLNIWMEVAASRSKMGNG